jgi:catechol 2,3-dioxygenase
MAADTQSKGGARSGSPGALGIERASYIAMHSPDPAAAAKFAVDFMGLDLVHVDGEGRHYLAARGFDPYSLVYTPGEQGIDHVSYVVRGKAALAAAERALTAAGVASEQIPESPMWRKAPSLRFHTPSGAAIELATGIAPALPMSWMVNDPPGDIAPISFEHAVLRASDTMAQIEFASSVMGLRESGRIVAPDGIPILAFFRAHTIFHCFASARSGRNGLHHYAFTLKNDQAVLRAAETIKAQGGAEVVWGPIRHGCGQNITFYFLDHDGNIVEYSAEEEIILNDDTYVVQHWDIHDIRATNEWGPDLPPEVMMG